MSYLDTEITRNEFINTRGAEKTQMGTRSSLNLFDRFCESTYREKGDSVVRNLESAINLTQSFPNASGDGWTTSAKNTSAGNNVVQHYAICLDVT